MQTEPNAIELSNIEKNPSRRVPWKVVIPIACLAALVFLILIFIKASRNGVYIYTETSGGFITPGKASVYYVTGIPFLKFKISDAALENRMRDTENAKDEAYFTVIEADSKAYRNGQYDENYDMVFPYGEFIYYHGEGRNTSLREYNRTSGQIREIPVNTNSGITIGTDKTMQENITVLSLLSIDPDFEKQVKKRKGIVWYAFYDERDGRIFYEQGNNIYEYLPQSKKSRLVYKAGKAVNIRAVYSMR